jgi:hypothetical protein
VREYQLELASVPVIFADNDPRGWKGSAVFSTDGKYRYELRREWTNGTGGVLGVLLNPSDANAYENDPTVGRMCSFVRAMRKQWFALANMFAFKTPYPEEMLRAHREGVDIVGPENDATIAKLAAAADMIIVAWGSCSKAPGLARGRARELVSPGGPLHGRQLHALRVTSGKAPEHPLYLPSELIPHEYSMATLMEWIEPKNTMHVGTAKNRKW